MKLSRRVSELIRQSAAPAQLGRPTLSDSRLTDAGDCDHWHSRIKGDWLALRPNFRLDLGPTL